MEIKLYEYYKEDGHDLYIPGIVITPGFYRFIVIENEDDCLAYECVFSCSSNITKEVGANKVILSRHGALFPPVEIRLVRSYPNDQKEINSQYWKECDFGYTQVLDPLREQLKEIVERYGDKKPEFEESACRKLIDLL